MVSPHGAVLPAVAVVVVLSALVLVGAPLPLVSATVVHDAPPGTSAAAAAAGSPAAAASPSHNLTMPSFLSSDMVLQRDGARLWGWAHPGAQVHLRVVAETAILASANATADAEGSWVVEVRLAAHPSTTVTVGLAGSSADLVLRNVAFGDVYLCSGQSNMVYPVADAENGAAERANSTYPGLRLLTFADTSSSSPARDCKSEAPYVWAASSPDALSPRTTSGSFGAAYPSAACYFAGRDILLSQQAAVPVGLITAAWSGSPIERWMTAPMMLDGTPQQLGGNGTCGGTRAPPPGPAPPRTTKCPAGGLENAGGMFLGMIHPLLPMRLSGIMWYQGEENDHAEDACPGPIWYSCLFPAMITGWRTAFGAPKLPFLYVLLASGHTAALREAQTAAQLLANTAFASAYDLGASPAEEIIPGHPIRKQEVGRRLALAALALVYGNSSVDYRGPHVQVANVTARRVGARGVEVRVPFDVGSNGFLHMNGTAVCTKCCASWSPLLLHDPDQPAQAATLLSASVVGANTLVGTVDSFRSSKGRALVLFQFDDTSECALYNGHSSGPNSHNGIVAESWSGNVTLTLL